MKPLLVVITGPTAVGKTSTSIQLAKHFGCPIVSADSRQVYKEMSIGTAVPTHEELKQVEHYFVHSHSIHTPLNAGIYENECIALLDNLFQKNKIIVLSGGSGLYINAVLFGHDEFPSANHAIRNELIKSYEANGLSFLQDALKAADPTYYAEVDQQNPQRLIRALEVYKQTGKPYSSFRKSTPKARNFEYMLFAINEDRESLYTRINKRVDEMMSNGLLDEAKALYLFKELNAVQTVGYTELFNYLDSNYTLEQAIDKIKQHSRNYAKRQLTWIKKYEEVQWVSRSESDKIIQLIGGHLQ